MQAAYPYAYSIKGNTVFIFLIEPNAVQAAKDNAEFLDSLVRIGGAISGLCLAALAGVGTGYHYLKRKIAQVSTEVTGESRTPGQPETSTLRSTVDEIRTAVANERTERLSQHADNQHSMQTIELRMKIVEEAVQDVKQSTDRISNGMETIIGKLLEKI